MRQEWQKCSIAGAIFVDWHWQSDNGKKGKNIHHDHLKLKTASQTVNEGQSRNFEMRHTKYCRDKQD